MDLILLPRQHTPYNTKSTIHTPESVPVILSGRLSSLSTLNMPKLKAYHLSYVLVVALLALNLIRNSRSTKC